MLRAITATGWLAAASAVRFEQASLEDDAIDRLRAFSETGLRALENDEKLSLTVSSFTETNRTSFPEVPYFWQDRLQIVRQLGQGSYGEVFKAAVKCAADPNASFVTLKLIEEKTHWTEREIEYLQRMNQASDYCSSSIGSPSSFVTDEGTWITMPFLNHGDFLALLNSCLGDKHCRRCHDDQKRRCWDGLISDGRDLSTAFVLALFYQVVRGVEALHDSGIIHTDLKPENAMINCKDGKCYASVIDLGLACEPKKKGSCKRTGTPSYVAPEIWQWRPQELFGDGALSDPKRDVWSLGVMLYVLMYSRTPPFFRDVRGHSQILYRAMKDEQIPSPQRTIDILITQMLETDPSLRADIRGVLRLLEQTIKDDYNATSDIIAMLEQMPVDRGATTPVPACLFDKVDYDVGDKPFEREFCTDKVEKARGPFRCGFCLGCNPCCKCRVLRHGEKVKEYFRMQVCQ